MLIGIDASRANNEHKSGTQWYSYYLIRNLAKIDSENEYVLYADKALIGGLSDLINPSEKSQGDKPEFDEDGIQIIRSPHNNFKAKILTWPFSYFWTLGRLSLEVIVSAPDILFIPAHALPFIFPEVSVNTIHDVAFMRDESIYRRDEVQYDRKIFMKLANFVVRAMTYGRYDANSLDYLKWSTKFSLKHSREIITVSNSTKEELLHHYKVNPEKINVVHNGFNNSLYRKINDQKKIDEILSKYGVERPYILYNGRIEKKKNTSKLIEAFSILMENKKIAEKLVLVGDASFGYDEVNYTIREFRLNRQVQMPGWVEEKDMPYFYNGASAFVFPSKYEGFGIPILQAMACGIPVAASNIGVFREVAGESAVFFDQNDETSIANALKSILLDEPLRSRLVSSGLEHASHFSWERTARETLKIFNKYKNNV